MLFKNIIGQDSIKEKLSALISEKRLPHAMMLLAPQGSGGLPMALAVAQSLVCEKRNDTAPKNDDGFGASLFGEPEPTPTPIEWKDACGECPACQKAQKLIHPDIHFTFPTIKPEKQKTPPISADFAKEWRTAVTANPYQTYNDWLAVMDAENKQGNITNNECHEIIKRMSLKTFEAPYKIQIIWLAEFLKEAGNTLLKIIEEPPADTIFILVVENIEGMLNTIISRTQIIKLPPIEDHILSAYLSKKFQANTAATLQVARIAEGNLALAEAYMQGVENSTDKFLQEWFSIALRIKSPNIANQKEGVEKLATFIDEIAKIGRENQKVFLKFVLWYLREVHLLSLGASSQKLGDDELIFAQKLAKVLNTHSIAAIEEIINELYYGIERNGNAKILFTAATINLSTQFEKK